jgi:hypothetical protein
MFNVIFIYLISHISTKELASDTYILAASFTKSLHVMSPSFSFSISVFAACLALPTAQP